VWIKSVSNYVQGESKILPVLDHHQCRFGAWLDGGGLIRHGEHLVYRDLEPAHRHVHDLATALCDLKGCGHTAEALAGLEELIDQQEALQVRINALVQENRHWADIPWSQGDSSVVAHDLA
jgi:hypothetical protein